MRRTAEKTDSSCSPPSDSTCAISPLLEHAHDRLLRQPVDLQVGVQGPQLVGDGQVAAHVAEPDR
jgi:hypothetical protein